MTERQRCLTPLRPGGTRRPGPPRRYGLIPRSVAWRRRRRSPPPPAAEPVGKAAVGGRRAAAVCPSLPRISSPAEAVFAAPSKLRPSSPSASLRLEGSGVRVRGILRHHHHHPPSPYRQVTLPVRIKLLQAAKCYVMTVCIVAVAGLSFVSVL